MKKYLLIVAVIFGVASCSERSTDDDLAYLDRQEKQGTIRSVDEALQIAETSINMLESSSTTRSALGRQIAVDKTRVYKLKEKTRTEENDTLLYVVNFENNEGFAVIAAPRSVEPLLAITESGYYDPEELTDIEGFNEFMEMAKRYVMERYNANELRSLDLYYKDEIITLEDPVGPYVTVKWGQTQPEGYYCSNGYSGCTNTAIAQIMTHYEYPTSISLTYPGADISTQSLNWTQMRLHQTQHPFVLCPNPDVHKSIGRLLRQIGELNSSIYHPVNENDTLTGTGTQSKIHVPDTMHDLGYQIGDTANIYSQTYVKNHLDENHVFFIRGQKTEKTGGHAWILDGYDNVTITHNLYYREGPSAEWLLISTTITNAFYVHYNWGWYGNCNGYFNGGVYDTQAGISYDTSTHTAIKNYQYKNWYLPIFR